jgi:hypothetical protein
VSRGAHALISAIMELTCFHSTSVRSNSFRRADTNQGPGPSEDACGRGHRRLRLVGGPRFVFVPWISAYDDAAVSVEDSAAAPIAIGEQVSSWSEVGSRPNLSVPIAVLDRDCHPVGS